METANYDSTRHLKWWCDENYQKCCDVLLHSYRLLALCNNCDKLEIFIVIIGDIYRDKDNTVFTWLNAVTTVIFAK